MNGIVFVDVENLVVICLKIYLIDTSDNKAIVRRHRVVKVLSKVRIFGKVISIFRGK